MKAGTQKTKAVLTPLPKAKAGLNKKTTTHGPSKAKAGLKKKTTTCGPSVSVERSRFQVMARSGLGGPGSTCGFKYGKGQASR